MSPGEAKRSEDKSETHVKTREKDQRQVRKSLDGVDIVESEGFWSEGFCWVFGCRPENLWSATVTFFSSGRFLRPYTYITMSVSSFQNVNCMRACEYMRASIYIAKNYYGIKVRIFAYISFDFTFHMLFNYTEYIAIIS